MINTPEIINNYTPEASIDHTTGDKLTHQEIKSKEINKEKIYKRIFDYWNSKNIIVHRTLNQNRKAAIQDRLNDSYTDEEILQAINNDSTVLESERHFFTHKYNFEEFLNP